MQIFDSWAGVLPVAEFERWCARAVAPRIVAKVRARRPRRRSSPSRGARRRSSASLPRSRASRRSASTPRVEPNAAAAALPERLALQGNLDPLALLAGGDGLDEGVDRMLAGFAGRPHIFNLGHGILPETPIDHVERLVGAGAGAN